MSQSAQEVCRELILSVGAFPTVNTREGTSRKGVVDSISGVGGGEKMGRNGRPLITTNLRDGWMASPLLGQAFDPEALDRCPRGVLQVSWDGSSHPSVVRSRCSVFLSHCAQRRFEVFSNTVPAFCLVRNSLDFFLCPTCKVARTIRASGHSPHTTC